MILEDVECGVFGLLVNWLYTRKVEDAEEPYVKVAELAKLWTLAQRFFMPALQNDALTRISEAFDYYTELELRTEAENKESSQTKWVAAISEDVNAWCSIAYMAKEMTALKRYLLDRMLAAACETGSPREGDKEVPEWIARSCLRSGGRSMLEDFSMVLAKHCSDFEADKKSHLWTHLFYPNDYMVPVED